MKKQEETRPRRVRNDILLIAVLLLVAAVGALYLFVFRGAGNTVTVTVDGQLYATYALSDTVEVDIDSGDGTNRLIIRDGKAFVETASCPDGICVAHRPIFRDGESIVCLPNRVVVTVTSREQTDAPDIVV
ncbi:MAG: NusG domain II-containing protein [Ruminococcaceae bacterium]|nr:NusG domain II-containing protein [Oscillospiraceae bacterium]